MLIFLQQFADYNLWANERLARSFNGLTEEQLTREIKSSFSSIRKTVAHIHFAEDIWLQRLKDIKPTIPFKDDPAETTFELINRWLKGSDLLKEYVFNMKESDLEANHVSVNSKGETHTDGSWQMLTHCFNHSTYHRGQLVTFLHHLDISNIDGTDLIAYYRELKV